MKVQGYTARVSGHALFNEGRPYGYGSHVAQCTCGKVAPVNSTAHAKRWHREHKARVVAANREVMRAVMSARADLK